MTIKSEGKGRYVPSVLPRDQEESEDAILRKALGIVMARMKQNNNDLMDCPEKVRQMLKLHIAQEKNYQAEQFMVIHLDNRHRLIDMEVLFKGTIDGAQVYPREVVKSCLAANSAAVVLAHNHPSGDPDPSEADKRITDRLKEALALVDIRVLDHIIIGAGDQYVSFAEHGLI